ncbi:plasmid partitioning protein [Methylobacterium indicum]|uniref:plasmid partitioning protein RepB n=1 Tax=Methylobacterium indicum TaxID=1775910 RepID=UPI0007348582|nr:plasmid partitioning protein RepB [Methylobacterium indicum]KTS27600.1 plasmid partitioning protein [Methylobacterium indicum]KTS41486.1 plasmid partitioning protein [Methylobacterium indicum]KTS52480.1 plasmid partitioning protein [Methylobacterium indicum]
MKRKDALRAALGARSLDREAPPAELPTGNPVEAPATDPATEAPRQLVRSGAVGAMGRSLGRIASAAAEARAMVASGDRVVELDTALVDGSFVKDRLSVDPEEHAAFVALIRERGQQVPILVRPHPSEAGRYQVAYGHRRLRAAIELGRPVRAVVKTLTDEDLVVAQGQENSARADLSYIERALFAIALEDRGFDRATVMAALAVEKTQLSRLIGIGRAIPVDIVTAIGPAPKTGRPRWTALVEALAREGAGEVVGRVLATPDFSELSSDDRFARLFSALTAPAPRPAPVPAVWTTLGGRPVVRIDRGRQGTQLTVDDSLEPDFAAYLIQSLPQLYAAFAESKTRDDTD